MPNLNFQFEQDHTRVDVGYALRTGGGLNICLLQLSSTIDEALCDAARPIAVSVLRDLLQGPNHPQPALQQLLPGGGPVLVVAPEYALGSGDWNAVDRIVRATNRTLVRNRSLSGVLLPPAPTRNNPSHVHEGGAGSDQGDSDQQQVAAA